MPHSLVTALPHNVVMSLVEWTRAQAWAWFNGTPMRIVGTIVGALVLRWLLHRVIRRAVALAMSRGETQERSRTGAVIAPANATGNASPPWARCCAASSPSWWAWSPP